MKNVSELSTLCGIDVCAIMYNPYESQPKKHCKDNREEEMTQVMFNNISGEKVICGLNLGDLYDLNWLLDEKMRDIDKRIAALDNTPLNP
ncbi:hypothetical protein Godav_012369 [Gossypium davidsonii]|uniref:MADS-box domain-containing protein n=1 Tax=Gossypium davidsonii TaxID=34287 RepID=A0A7J8REB9_GOSDV|nr:hypothetical protein [Gossypium davidsonii]